MADNTYLHGTDQYRTARQDLGEVMARWFTEYGLGPNSKYVGFRASGRLDVDASGQINLLTKSNQFYDAGLSQQGYKRGVSGDFHAAHPATVESWNVNPIDYGMKAEYDDNDPLNVSLGNRQGVGAVEERHTRRSLERMLQGFDLDLLTALGAASTPFDYADTDADANWATPATATPIANISAAQRLYQGRPDSVMWEEGTLSYFRQAAELTTRFGGNIGAGTLSDDLVMSALGTFGIRQMFVADENSALGDDAVLFQRGGGDPMVEPCGIIRCVQNKPGQDAFGIEYFTGNVQDNPRKQYSLAVCMCDYVIISSLGVRIKDTQVT